MRCLDRFRPVRLRLSPGQHLLRLLVMLLAGAATGVLAKWLDFSGGLLGNVLSELPVYILLGLLIARFSGGPGRAASYAFAFFAAMVAAYYLAAKWMGGVYGMAFVHGWSAVACLSAPAALIAWYAFGHGWLPDLLSVGVAVAAVLAGAVTSRGVHMRDLFLALLCAVLLFGEKIMKRSEP